MDNNDKLYDKRETIVWNNDNDKNDIKIAILSFLSFFFFSNLCNIFYFCYDLF